MKTWLKGGLIGIFILFIILISLTILFYLISLVFIRPKGEETFLLFIIPIYSFLIFLVLIIPVFLISIIISNIRNTTSQTNTSNFVKHGMVIGGLLGISFVLIGWAIFAVTSGDVILKCLNFSTPSSNYCDYYFFINSFLGVGFFSVLIGAIIGFIISKFRGRGK